MVTAKNMSSSKNEKYQNETKKSKSKSPPGLISRLLYIWTFPLFYNGNRRDLEDEDLVPTNKKYNSKIVGDDLER